MESKRVEALIEVIQKVRRGLNSYGDLDERQIESCAVEPLLAALGWEPFPWDRRNQYRLDGGAKVDIGLGEFGDDVMNPRVFIECKRPGRLSPAGETQLFEYAQGRGIPLLVLTDGKRWDLYLSMAPGAASERRFESIELSGEPPEDVADKLWRYLEKSAVLSNRAAVAAEARRVTSEAIQKVERRMAETWAAILSEPDKAVSKAFEARLVQGLPPGLQPDQEKLRESVESFLRRRAALAMEEPPAAKAESKRARAGKFRWRRRGETVWRHSGRQSTGVMQIAEDILARRFGGDGAEMLAAWEKVGGEGAWQLRRTAEEGVTADKGYEGLAGDGDVSIYLRTGWELKVRLVKKLIALEGGASPIEAEHGAYGEAEGELAWKPI